MKTLVILSFYLMWLHRGFNMQYVLLKLFENWSKSLKNKGFVGAL